MEILRIVFENQKVVKVLDMSKDRTYDLNGEVARIIIEMIKAEANSSLEDTCNYYLSAINEWAKTVNSYIRQEEKD